MRLAGSVLTTLLFLMPSVFRGQGPVKLEFEVASVRASGPPPRAGGTDEASAIMADALSRVTSEKGGPGTEDPERLTISRMPLRVLLFKAFGVRPDQILGPEWLDSDRFDVTAKIAPGTTKEQANVMLQNLLLERFEITLHHAMRDLPVYELTVARSGSKLKEGEPASEAPAPVANAAPRKSGDFFHVDLDSNGFPIVPKGASSIFAIRGKDGLNYMTCKACTLAELIPYFSFALSVSFGPSAGYGMAGHVVDKTGLTGKYSFHLQYAGDAGAGGALPPPPVDGPAVSGPDLFSALEKQLGLKLERAKAPLDVLVIDHVDKIPTEN